MSGHTKRYEDEDDAYDTQRQNLVDAFMEGEQARRQGVDRCPYYAFEPEWKEWHSGFAGVISS